VFSVRSTVRNRKVTCIWLLSLWLSSYTYFSMSVQSHSHIAASWDTSTQDYDNTGVPFTAITWQETQKHRLMRMFELNNKIRIWKYCAVMLLVLSMESSVNEGNTTAQHFIVKILYVAKLCDSNCNRYCMLPSSVTVTIIDTLISVQLHFSVVIFQCGACGSIVIKALRYKPAGRGFNSRWCHWNFSVK
jgi:hypothetical protein